MRFPVVKFMLFFLLINASCTQNNKYCQDLAEEEHFFEDIKNNIPEFQDKFKQFIYCEFDSIDYQIFLGPKEDLIQLLVRYNDYSGISSKIEKSFTFNDLKPYLINVKKSEEYLIARPIVEARNNLIYKKAQIENWEEDKRLMEIMRFEENQIAMIKEVVVENEENELTYAEIFEIAYPIIFEEDLKTGTVQSCENANELWENTYTLPSYDDCLKCSEKLEKPLLIYFSAWGSVECRQFEAEVLINEVVQNIIGEKYTYVVLIVDEKASLKENETYFSESQQIEIKTIGQKNLDIQIEKFGNSKQPFFAIVDLNAKVRSTFDGAIDIEKFKAFLIDETK